MTFAEERDKAFIDAVVNDKWMVEGFSDDAQFTVHAWCDIDPYDFKEGGITWTN